MEKIRPFAKTRIGYIVNLIDPKKTDRVLNIGVSNIPEIEMIIEDKVAECVTVDIDKKKINEAKKHVKKAKILYGDITKGGLKKNYFDKIVILEVLEHLDDDDKTVKILKESLRKGGVIIAAVPNRSPLHILNPVMYAEHKRHYSNSMLKTLFTKNGFTVTHFNVVESWAMLVNLYHHIIMKFFLRRNVPFGLLKSPQKTYRQLNKNGMDLIIMSRLAQS